MQETWAPGRVNLIGEHIDYHGLPVLPIALSRRIHVRFRSRSDRLIHAESPGYGAREFEWSGDLQPVQSGDWENYLRAAARALWSRFPPVGIDAIIDSDLPPAAGLSSSSALIVAFTLALLRANDQPTNFEELMALLPDAEQFVGTRGGGMDHAAALASREGCATLIDFCPLAVRHVRIPDKWRFLVANSGERAEKSGAVREEYNSRRAAGTRALQRLALASYKAASELDAAKLEQPDERDAFLHVTSESRRVRDAVSAIENDEPPRFGKLLLESHASLRDRLRVSTPALDRLVEESMAAGAWGARLTGAGFGGCVVIACSATHLPLVRTALEGRYELIESEPGPGALWGSQSWLQPAISRPPREM